VTRSFVDVETWDSILLDPNERAAVNANNTTKTRR
jgi:hypothetical protein